MLPLSSYELLRLPGVPDAAGCVQLEPLPGCADAERAWIRIPSVTGGVTSRVDGLDGWVAALADAKRAADAEAAEATHSLLRMSLGDAAADQALTAASHLQAPHGSGPDGAHAQHDLTRSNRALSMRLNQSLSVPQQQETAFRLEAAAAAVRGAMLTKFVLGRRKRHPRFVRVVAPNQPCNPTPRAKLRWGSNEGIIARLDEVPPAGLQKEQRLGDDELARCFAVRMADGKAVVLMAPSPRDKHAWLAGIHTVTHGLGSQGGQGQGAGQGRGGGQRALNLD